jgi:hypothetical protein
MTAPATLTAATRALEATVELLAAAGIAATRDAGAFYPQPTGVLVGLPTLRKRGLASSTYEIPVYVVSGDPLNDELPVDRLYALADDVALALATDQYRPSSYGGGANAEPLPALELTATVTVTQTGGLP